MQDISNSCEERTRARQSIATVSAFQTRKIPWPTSSQPCPSLTMNRTNAGEIYSFHTGGTNLLRCDGSVTFLRSTATIGIVAALITRDHGEVLPHFSKKTSCASHRPIRGKMLLNQATGRLRKSSGLCCFLRKVPENRLLAAPWHRACFNQKQATRTVSGRVELEES